MTRPNILILQTDQQRWDALGASGNPDIQTPNLDRLASEGVRFDHCFVQSPVCMPSRVSFLTGQYPSQLRITHMGVPVPPETVTLPRLLRPAGYVSANIGKLHFLPHANRDHREPHPDYGFDVLAVSDEPGCYEDAYRAWVRAIDPDALDHISVGLPPAARAWQAVMGGDGIVHPEERFPRRAQAFRAASHLTHSAFVADGTIDFIDRHAGSSWMCVAGFYSPHEPWVVPQEFLDRYDPDSLALPQFPPDVDPRRRPDSFSDSELRSARHGYYAMVTEVDHHVGRILAALESSGCADHTVVVFTSDHGEWLGEHLRYGKGHPGHDAASRVPLLVRWPDGARAGHTCSDIVELVDVVPTLLDCLRLQVPPALQGRSLTAALQGLALPDHELALTELAGWKTVRTRSHRYVCEADGREALYDLREPLGDYTDIAGRPDAAAVLSDVRARLLTRLLQIERPRPRTWTY